MRTALSIKFKRYKSQPSSPATKPKVPSMAVKTLHKVELMLTPSATPIKSTGLSKKKKGMMKPMMPNLMAHSPVRVWSEPAMPEAT